MKQKLLGLAGLFLMVLVFCYGSAVRAEIPYSNFSVERTVAKEVLDAYLLEQGFPQETVADLDYGTKLTYYEEQAEFVGEVITYFDENGWVISRRQMGKPWKELSAKDQADTQMTLTLSLSEAGTEERYLMIRLAYDWRIHPSDKYEDLMCLSYPMGALYQHNNGFSLVDMQIGPDGEEQIYRRGTLPAMAGSSGSSWYVNVQDTQMGTGLQGYSISKMDPKEPAGTLTLQGYYVHCTENAKLSYEWKESVGVVFSGTGGYEQMEAWGKFEYDLTD